MKSKPVKIIIEVIASIVVFVLTLVAASEVLTLIVGTTKDASGAEKIKGGYAITVVVFGLGILVTLAFGLWFYRFLNRKSTAIGE